MSASTGPVEVKVTAAAIAAAVSSAVLWALDTYVFVADSVPAPVAGLAELVIVTGATFAAGWLARHTPRSDPDARPDLTPPTYPPGPGPRTT